MGGISANKPILPLLTGPMMPGSHRGQRIGACTDCRNNWAKYRAGEIDIDEISAINEELAPTVSTLYPEDQTKSADRSLVWYLRRHGHGEYHGVHHCCPRLDASTRRLSARGIVHAPTHSRGNRSERGCCGQGKANSPGNPDQGILPQCHNCPASNWWFDKWHCPSHGYRQPSSQAPG